jgi:hypothetical protein
LTDEISKEILLHLRIRLGKDDIFFGVIKVLSQIISNILKDPLDEKFHKLKMQNKKI